MTSLLAKDVNILVKKNNRKPMMFRAKIGWNWTNGYGQNS